MGGNRFSVSTDVAQLFGLLRYPKDGFEDMREKALHNSAVNGVGTVIRASLDILVIQINCGPPMMSRRCPK